MPNMREDSANECHVAQGRVFFEAMHSLGLRMWSLRGTVNDHGFVFFVCFIAFSHLQRLLSPGGIENADHVVQDICQRALHFLEESLQVSKASNGIIDAVCRLNLLSNFLAFTQC